jgi:hypothetical protein
MLLAALAGAIAGGILVHGRGQPGAQLAPSRYAGRQVSGIRGLTTQEIDDLLQGRGAGFARTAELNGYAGPHHALDLAKELALSPEQRAVAESLFAAMRAAARALGAEIVDGERRLSAGFAERRITPADLEAQAESLGVRYGRLRAVHLAAHVALTRHLTHEQIRRYDALRGYDAHAPADTGAHDHGL